MSVPFLGTVCVTISVAACVTSTTGWVVCSVILGRVVPSAGEGPVVTSADGDPVVTSADGGPVVTWTDGGPVVTSAGGDSVVMPGSVVDSTGAENVFKNYWLG